VTITTGGVPKGALSDAPKMRDIIKSTAPNAHTPSKIACTLLLRSTGSRTVRVT
jgi:hypothetical protein